ALSDAVLAKIATKARRQLADERNTRRAQEGCCQRPLGGKRQKSSQFYFSGMPTIVNAEGNDASDYFTYISAMDAGLEGNSYILQAQNWEGTVAPAGVYTITLSKASFMNMMQWKAPAEDIVLTVEIIVTGIDNINADANAVIYDIHGRRVEKMEKGIYIVNGKKVIKK
ncbi:MAG: hypothetical protein IJ941_01915, partial [Clostridia bacterium]|nr:hypothetical protein [Clostridia bacterium]